MFQNLSQRLTKIFDGLKSHGALTEEQVSVALREVRVALLEADVALPVVKDLVRDIKEKAIGSDVLQSITPAQQVIKIVHEHLTAVLGGTGQELDLSHVPPVVIYMVGLQGSGKTTSTAKLALHLKNKLKKKVFVASTDIYRPAAREQLAQLATKIDVGCFSLEKSDVPVDIVKQAHKQAKLDGADVLIVDTAGRLHIDDALMQELQSMMKAVPGQETLLLADALTGQDAVNVAQSFKEAVPLSGIILTRLDGDARGGAALSMTPVTGCVVKFAGVSEQPDGFEVFHPERIAQRILGMGDVVTLVEKAAEAFDEDEAIALSKSLQKGAFTFDMLENQLLKMGKMGGLGGILKMLPGAGKMQDQLTKSGVDDNMVKKQIAIIRSMNSHEKRDPKVLNGSRKRRIAAGSGTSVMEVNRLLKQFRDMATMMKRMKKMGKKSLLSRGLPGMFPGKPKF